MLKTHSHCLVNVPILNIRQKPEVQAEMGSQALFAEEISVLSEVGNWVLIETVSDRYRGWASYRENDLVAKGNSPYADQNRLELHVNRLAAHVYREPDTIYGPFLTLPFGCRLVALDAVQQGARWVSVILPDGSSGYIQSGDVGLKEALLSRDEVCQKSLDFLGIPYTWGGRSSFGLDCSGLVQMLYRQMGVFLPRDSKDQFLFEGLKNAAVADLQPGDLIFFGDIQKTIKHVGMKLNEHEFIHTSAVTENKPYVRISSTKDLEWNGKGYYPHVVGKAFRGN